MKKKFNTQNEFFASANGYYGFKSYFTEIFNSVNFEKIFILKGGPGTGKSSMLKKLFTFCSENKLCFEVFRCSSDPESLDAIIIDKDGVRIAVIDGTAPHTREADIPGAIDEIVNLGIAWDENKLKKQRAKIIDIGSRKNAYYARAYEYLRYSSVFDSNIKAEIISILDFDSINRKCNEVIDAFFDKKNGINETRLISSFSKNGYKTLDAPSELCKKVYSIFGRFGSDNIFINSLIEMLKSRNVPFCRIPSPLDFNTFEGVYLNNRNTLIFGMGDGEILCDTSSFLKIKDPRDFENRMQTLENSKEYYLKLAANELRMSSEMHFMLEDIYTPTMNFDILNDIFDNILNKIKNIYQLSV